MVATNEAIKDIQAPIYIIPDDIPRISITFDSFSVQKYEEMFGLSKEDCKLLYAAFRIPELLAIEGWHCHVSGVHAFLYTLFRFHSPSQRMALDSVEWGYDYSSLSRIFNSVVQLIDINHRHDYADYI